MDRRKFVLSSMVGSSALLGLAGKVALSPRITERLMPSYSIAQDDFEKMLTLSAQRDEALFLPPGSIVRVTKPTRINISINGQGSQFYIENDGQLFIESTPSQDIHLRNIDITSFQSTNSSISIQHARDILLENINIHSRTMSPVVISHSQNIQIVRSRISFSSLSGIETYSSRDIQFQKNVFTAYDDLKRDQDFLLFDNVNETQIIDNLFKSRKNLAGLSFIGQPADQESIVKYNKFAAS